MCGFRFQSIQPMVPRLPSSGKEGKNKKVSLLNALLTARQLWRRLFLVLTENELIVVEENCIHGEEFIIIEGVNWLFFWISLVGNKHVI